jgi:L-aspartate oxidase
MPQSPTDCDVLIIGCGLAGLTLALSLPSTLRITVLSKSSADECASAWAQGGIAAVLDPADSLQAHVQDTLIAGAGLCDEAAVRRILSKAPRRSPGCRPRACPSAPMPTAACT